MVVFFIKLCTGIMITEGAREWRIKPVIYFNLRTTFQGREMILSPFNALLEFRYHSDGCIRSINGLIIQMERLTGKVK